MARDIIVRRGTRQLIVVPEEHYETARQRWASLTGNSRDLTAEWQRTTSDRRYISAVCDVAWDLAPLAALGTIDEITRPLGRVLQRVDTTTAALTRRGFEPEELEEPDRDRR